MPAFWVSSEKMTVKVRTDSGNVITWAAPVVSRFKGQHFSRLVAWMKRHGGLEVHEISEGHQPVTR